VKTTEIIYSAETFLASQIQFWLFWFSLCYLLEGHRLYFLEQNIYDLVGYICSVMLKQHLLPHQSTHHRSQREDCCTESHLNVAYQVSTC